MNLPLFAPVEVTVKRQDGVAETRLPGAVVRKDETGVAVEWAETLAGPLCPLLGCASRCPRARRRILVSPAPPLPAEQFSQLAQPQHRAADGKTAQPVSNAERRGRERLLQHGHMHHRNLECE